MMSSTFREVCKDRLSIAGEQFDEWVFWQCVRRRVRWLVWIRWQLDRDFHADDLDLIHSVGSCRTVEEVCDEIKVHRYHHPVTGFFRRVLGLRICGENLVALAEKYLPHQLRKDTSRPTPPTMA